MKKILIVFFIICGFIIPNIVLSEDKQSEKGEIVEYAIIINGKADFFQKKKGLELHAKNVVRAFEKLKKIGYEEKNIFVLSYNDPRTNKENPNNFRPGSFEAYKEIVAYLIKTIDENSSLLIYTTGHGDRYDNDNPWHSELIFDDRYISANKFVKIALEIPFEILIYAGDQCKSGGFVKTFEIQGKKDDRNIVAVSNSDHFHSAYCEPFSKGFWNALGNLQYDLNHDNFVSVEEAFSEGSRRMKIEMEDRQEEANMQYISIGTCKKRQNRFLYE